MIGDMNAFDGAPPAAVVATIMAAIAAVLGPDAGRYRLTAVRPLGWADGAVAAGGELWSVVGRQEAALVRHHFGEGRRR